MMKGKGNTRVSSQQAVYELKHRVVLALNKLADRDTYQIGVEELEKTIECLSPDGISPFLSCILDTDTEQKSAVRKECIRLMGILANFHEDLINPHLGKIMASIVKRLKDSDTIVREACVETVGVLASMLNRSEVENEGSFVVLVKPLFEALGEQNKHVQFGSALCLARGIDNIRYPPAMILQKMLARTVKLLRNPHFMAKPALIELNRSIVQAGGAATHSSLSAAITSVQEALKNSDWATRKAASSALGDIASSGGALIGSFRSSCIRSLESCRFDKVKPVRDTALQALHLWRNLPGADTPEPSEAGSSIKENSFRDDYGDATSVSSSIVKNATLKKFGGDLTKKRVSPSLEKGSEDHVEKPQQSGRNNWQIEIAVQKKHNISAADIQYQESEGSSVTKTCERTTADTRSAKDIEYDYLQMGDNQESASMSNLFSNTESKIVTANCDVLDDASFMKSTGISHQFDADEVSIEEQRYSAKMHDRRSLDSTITESNSHPMHGCCLQTEKEMALICKQLSEIESKQSNLMDLLKAFTSNIMDSMSMVQLKVSSLEQVVDRMAQELFHGERHSDVSATKFLKKGPSIISPRLSTCTPRPSVDLRSRQPTLLQTKSPEVWEDKTITRARSSIYSKQASNIWIDATAREKENYVGKRALKIPGPKIHSGQTRTENMYAPIPSTGARLHKSEHRSSPWKVVTDYLSRGDLDSAYSEALCFGNELVLFKLLERTGPVLENLSDTTTADLLSTLASYFSEKRFMNSIIPWLQQLVDLSTSHGQNSLMLPAQARKNFLSVIQEAAKEQVFSHGDRRFLNELGRSLCQIWGKGPS